MGMQNGIDEEWTKYASRAGQLLFKYSVKEISANLFQKPALAYV